MAIIEAMPRFATVSAVGDTRTLVISADTFKAILRDRPEVALAVMRSLSRRLREVH
jgi:CRP-like cAMP-binding protein